MLLREDSEGFLAIGQAAHAWVSGQLARAWGNGSFQAPEPWEEVCLAAEQHDLGMLDWDLEPQLNPDTRLPRSFMEMPLEAHLEIWEQAPRRMLAQSRYAALLVSMHGAWLYERRDLDTTTDPEDSRRVREFLVGQRAFQGDLVETLRSDPRMAEHATSDAIERNRIHVWTLDSLSLALLLDWAPFDLDEAGLHLGSDLSLDPWPFGERRLTVRCDGRRLAGGYDDQEELRAALSAAPWETLKLELRAP